MPLIHTETLKPNELSAELQHQTYCGLDCCVTLEVHQELNKLFHQPTAIYSFERALQGPYLEIMQRGFAVDSLARDHAARGLAARIDGLQTTLNLFAQAFWGKPLNPRSPAQLKDFFYKSMGLPEVWISQKGERKLSTNRETLEKLETYLYARPIISCILTIRDLSKQLEVFETEIDSDGRFRTSYNIAGTSTGRPSSSSNAFGTGCVRPTAEALTPTGWQPLSDLNDGALIAQWEAEKISFVPCKLHRGEFNGELLRCIGEQIDITVTPNHRVLYYTDRNKEKRTEFASNTATRSQAYIPVSGSHNGLLSYPPYLSMLMADFSKDKWTWRGEFTKQRKIQRFLQLAEEHQLEYVEQAARVGYRRFSVKAPVEWPKKWGPWVLDLTAESAEALVEEARHWDAHDRGAGFQFCTVDKEQAEWFATLVHLCKRGATVQKKPQSAGSYSAGGFMYIVNVKNRGFAQIMRKHWFPVKYTGPICCPEVPSSFWLVRENGKISVTGNSNAQNIAPALRYVFVADPGYKICVIDLEQVEARDVGYLCGVLFGDWNFLDACEGGDLHTTNARLIWPERKWAGDSKKDRILADQNFYRDFSYRDMSKRGGHLSNYLGSAWMMARALKIPIGLAEEFQARYVLGRRAGPKGPEILPAFPCIPRYWQWVAQELQLTNKLVTPFGRERHFFGRPGDETTVREAVAFLPQSTTADRMNLGLWRVWKHMPHVQLLAQTYDSITFQYLEKNGPQSEEQIVSEALERIRVELRSAEGRQYIVPGEAKVGWNWGACVQMEAVEKAMVLGKKPSRLNPDGLVKWKPGFVDSRSRKTGLQRTML